MIPEWALKKARSVFEDKVKSGAPDAAEMYMPIHDITKIFARALQETRSKALKEAAEAAYLAIGDGPVATVKAIEIQSAIRALRDRASKEA